MYSRDELEGMRGEGVLGDASPGVGSVWKKFKKGAKKVGKGVLKYNPITLQLKAAKIIGKWSGKKMAAAAKAITSAQAYPLKRIVRSRLLIPTAKAVAKRNQRPGGVPTKADKREANRIVISGLKHRKNPLLKFTGYVLSYVGTGFSGYDEVGIPLGFSVAGIAAAIAAVAGSSALLVMAFRKQALAGGGAPAEEGEGEGKEGKGEGEGEGEGEGGGSEKAEPEEKEEKEEPAEEGESESEGDTLFPGPY